MSVFGWQADRRSSFRLLGAKRYKEWAERQPADVRLSVESWLLGLYWAPWQAPSRPVRDPSSVPPEDLRRAELAVESGNQVTVIYDVWENLRVVRLLFID